MKISEIKEGKTYKSGRGRCRNTRKVIRIFRYVSTGPQFVEYEQEGERAVVCLKSFAKWCGQVVK